MNKFVIAAIIASLVAVLVIGGCAQQQQPKIPAEKLQPAPTVTPPAQQQPQQQPQQQQPAAEQPQPQIAQPQPEAAPADDIYNDNLDQAVEELSQLE